MDTTGRQRNKIWVDQGSEFYNRSMKSWLHDNAIEMYSAVKSVVAEIFFQSLEEKDLQAHEYSIKKCGH